MLSASAAVGVRRRTRRSRGGEQVWRSADPITIVTLDRAASAEALVFNDRGFVATSWSERQENADSLSASATSFDNTAMSADAQLTSAISADLRRFSGAAATSSMTDGPRGLGQSSAIFGVFFELDRPLAFHFEGAFEALGFAGGRPISSSRPVTRSNHFVSASRATRESCAT